MKRSKRNILIIKKEFGKLKTSKARLSRLKKLRKIVRALKKTEAFAGRGRRHLRRQIVFEHYSPAVKKFLKSLPIAEQRAAESALFDLNAEKRRDSLQSLKSKHGVPVLEEKLKDPSSRARIRALILLTDLKSKKSVKLIEQRLRDAVPQVRVWAITSLAVLDSKRSIPAIVQMINDPDTIVRDFARAAVNKLAGAQ